MKNLAVLFFVVINVYECIYGSLDYEAITVRDVVTASPTPDTSGCVDENYRHKSEAELAAMSPRQLLDEDAKEQLYHAPVSDDLYSGDLLHKYIRKAGVNILPVLADFMNAYDPKNASKCKFTRFFVAIGNASGFDRGLMRLRGIRDGQLAIKALENAVVQMRAAGFDKDENPQKSDLDFALLNLRSQKGINERDWLIQNTLKLRHGVAIIDDELLEFSNFLIARDPAYPAWSDVKESGPPWVLKKSKRYYEAYLNFKATKSGSEVVK